MIPMGCKFKMFKLRRRMMRWAGNVVHIEEKKSENEVSVGKSEEQRTLGRPRRK
jgi:hypothetical protein